MFSRKSADLVIAGLVGIVLVIAVASAVVAKMMGALAALAFVFFLPGYALTAALFAKRHLPFRVTLTLCLGLSIALTILAGLVLNMFPPGLTTLTWSLILGGLILGCAVIAALRRRDTDYQAQPLNIGLNPRQIMLLCASLIVAIMALVVAGNGARQTSASFTELWLLPSNAGTADGLEFGVHNMESVPMVYRLEVRMGNVSLFQQPQIELLPGATWQTSIALQTPRNADVQALLYRDDDPSQVYRQAVLRKGTR